MTKVISVNTVTDTSLWKQLNDQDSQDAKQLASNLVTICAEATERMKMMPIYAPQYTLHDETHLLRTTELMKHVLGATFEKLNTVETALLILSAFFHDQGMIPTAEEYSAIRNNSDFQLFKDNWCVEYPNYSQIEKQLASQIISEKERKRLAQMFAELDSTILTDYLRGTHAHRSSDYVRSQYGNDKRLEIYGINLAPFAALLCESHSLPASDLNQAHGFRFDEQIGTYTVNMVYLAVVLRLADILDFDRERAPEVLFKSIHFTSEVSIIEWEKHRSVQGWSISPKRIRFTMRSKHPIYEATARKFMDYVDSELSACHELCITQPANFKEYQLRLPIKVDRSRISPLDNAYHFHDLEFHLSRDEIVRLLMTDKLYGHSHLCIRELLQNALDALRYRKALFLIASNQWEEGNILLKHSVDENGYELIECCDNGSGMDENILTNYLVKVGRSFYRSPEFERERIRLRAAGHDFDPCSKFGIGFMSCFMLGDRITIKTRRDYGPSKGWGSPMVVEIHGLGGLLVIRDGPTNQPIGTTVTIFGRRKPAFLDEWVDNVNLVLVLKGYALATEFPIKGMCTIPEIKGEVVIPPTSETIPTRLEIADVKKCLTLEQDLAEIDSDMHGEVRESFLLDEQNLPCLANNEARWNEITENSRKKWALQFLTKAPSKDAYQFSDWYIPVCVDGILVAGDPGRPSFYHDVRRRLGNRNSFIYSQSPAMIDARGDIKPEITPGRIAPDHSAFDMPLGWQRLNDKFGEASGRMWEKLTNYLTNGLSELEFWKLTSVYGAWLPSMRRQCLWETVSVPLVTKDGTCQWQKIRELGELSIFVYDEKSFELRNADGCRIALSPILEDWEKQGVDRPYLRWHMNITTLLMCSAQVVNNGPVLMPAPPTRPEEVLSQWYKRSSMGPIEMLFLDYIGSATDALSIQMPYPTANRRHPLAKVWYDSKYLHEKSDIQEFATSFVPCVAYAVSSSKNSPSLDQPGYWQKRVAHQYFAMDWKRYSDDLKPPYKIWTSQKGWTQIGENELAFWRDAKTK
jgi:hypothetical protein